MYCPKCSQQQLSEDVRFCSRCGLPLQFVVELLASEGIPNTNLTPINESAPLFKRRGVRIGAKIIFLSVFLIVPALILSIIFDDPTPLLIPVIPFLIGVAQILYTVLFGESIIPLKKEQTSVLTPREPLFGLPDSQYTPPFINPNPLSTNELKQPVSITETTTKLLKKEQC